MRIPRCWLPAFLLAGVAFAGCSDSPTGGGDPRVTVRLTDAPGDVAAAVVTISEIHLVGSDGKVVLMSEPVTTDLLDLASTTITLVEGIPVPEGTYTQLRFIISGGYLEVENANGTTSIFASSPTYSGLPPGAPVAGSLQMPSLAQSGLKVTFPSEELEIEDDQVFLVDFEVSQSFGRLAGNSGMWVMHPVITGTVED